MGICNPAKFQKIFTFLQNIIKTEKMHSTKLFLYNSVDQHINNLFFIKIRSCKI